MPCRIESFSFQEGPVSHFESSPGLWPAANTRPRRAGVAPTRPGAAPCAQVVWKLPWPRASSRRQHVAQHEQGTICTRQQLRTWGLSCYRRRLRSSLALLLAPTLWVRRGDGTTEADSLVCGEHGRATSAASSRSGTAPAALARATSRRNRTHRTGMTIGRIGRRRKETQHEPHTA